MSDTVAKSNVPSKVTRWILPGLKVELQTVLVFGGSGFDCFNETSYDLFLPLLRDLHFQILKNQMSQRNLNETDKRLHKCTLKL